MTCDARSLPSPGSRALGPAAGSAPPGGLCAHLATDRPAGRTRQTSATSLASGAALHDKQHCTPRHCVPRGRGQQPRRMPGMKHRLEATLSPGGASLPPSRDTAEEQTPLHREGGCCHYPSLQWGWSFRSIPVCGPRGHATARPSLALAQMGPSSHAQKTKSSRATRALGVIPAKAKLTCVSFCLQPPSCPQHSPGTPGGMECLPGKARGGGAARTHLLQQGRSSGKRRPPWKHPQRWKHSAQRWKGS